MEKKMTNVPKQVVRDEEYGRILTIVKGPKARVDQVLHEMMEKYPTDLYGTAVESREIDVHPRAWQHLLRDSRVWHLSIIYCYKLDKFDKLDQMAATCWMPWT